MVTELPIPKLHFKLSHVLRILLWAGLLVPWTWALLTPVPPHAVRAVGGATASFYFGKALHLGVYAALAFLTAWLPMTRKWRLLLIVLLIAHGGSTEYLQQFVERGASWRDFGLDSFGVSLGCLLGWRRWRSGSDLLGKSPQEQLQHDPAGKHSDASPLR
jgi:hypothetical protein